MNNDKAKKLYNALTDIDDDFVEQAARPAIKKKRFFRIIPAAAVVLLAVTVALLLPHRTQKQPLMPDSKSNNNLSIADNTLNDAIPQNAAPALSGDGPVSYDSLPLDGRPATDTLQNGDVLDITSFDEEQLASDDLCAIVQGKITDIYTKHYKFDIYSDKFEADGITKLHSFSDTIVYEIEVQKSWYGQDFAGATLKVEDEFCCPDSIFCLCIDGEYVLPIYEYGPTLLTWDTAEGDLTRDGVYSTVYPFHPQIRVTQEGDYIVPDDWETLTSGPCREITTNFDDGLYFDRLKLVEGADFEEKMALLTEKINSQKQ